MKKTQNFVTHYLVLEIGDSMLKVGLNVIITGGSEVNWKEEGKPYYIEPCSTNKAATAYRNKEICTIFEIEPRENEVKLFNLLNTTGEKLTGFYAWELALIDTVN